MAVHGNNAGLDLPSQLNLQKLFRWRQTHGIGAGGQFRFSSHHDFLEFGIFDRSGVREIEVEKRVVYSACDPILNTSIVSSDQYLCRRS